MEVPNPLTAVKAAIRVVEELVQGNPVLVSQEVCDARQAICNACEFLDPDIKQCKQCSCFILLKTQISTEVCPINKW